MKMTDREVDDCSAYVMQRLKSTDIAVFKIASVCERDGKVVEVRREVKTIFPGGARFDLMCSEYPDALVGVYTLKGEGVYREQILEDIRVTPGVVIKKTLASD